MGFLSSVLIEAYLLYFLLILFIYRAGIVYGAYRPIIAVHIRNKYYCLSLYQINKAVFGSSRVATFTKRSLQCFIYSEMHNKTGFIDPERGPLLDYQEIFHG